MDKADKCEIRTYRNTRNPILPVDIHIPDGEAHVMPDGKLYIYGSYDDCENTYCSEKYHVVSTLDMRNWTIYGESFHGKQVPWFNSPDALKYVSNDWSEPTEFVKKMQENTDGDDINFVLSQGEGKPLLFAPDCIYKNGKYYLYFCMADGSEGVAVSDHPQGPFKDPVQLPCGGIDPAIFVDDDGQAYYYWGQFRSNAVLLNQDMVSFNEKNIVRNFLTEENHYFHEGSSVRKIGDTYYCVFADIERGKPTALGYATGKSPLGPFTYRGILINNEGCDPSSWNNHGSLECFHGQWYVFYHRSSRNTKIFRRLCIEPITINEDGSINEVKMTSQGPGKPFGPGEEIMGYQACCLKGDIYIDAVEECAAQERLSHIQDGDEAVFRYVKSDCGFKKILFKAVGSGKVTVLFDRQPMGETEIIEGRQDSGEFQVEAGEYELTLKFSHVRELEIESFILE